MTGPEYGATKGDTVDFAISVLGVIALLTPLMLWVSWSTTVFYVTLSVGVGACLIIVALTKFFPEKRLFPARAGSGCRR